MKHLITLYPYQHFFCNGEEYVVLQHEENMTEVFSINQKRSFAFWCWIYVTPCY